MIKRILSVILIMSVLLMMISVRGLTVDSAAADLTISTPQQLKDFATAVNSGTDYSGQTVALANDITLTPEEKTAAANGDSIDIILVVEDAGDAVPNEDKKAAEDILTNTKYTIGMYLNIDLIKLINGQQVGKITKLNSPINVTVEIPEVLRSANREFVIVRVHNGTAEILEDVDSDPDTITIVSDKFYT